MTVRVMGTYPIPNQCELGTTAHTYAGMYQHQIFAACIYVGRRGNVLSRLRCNTAANAAAKCRPSHILLNHCYCAKTTAVAASVVLLLTQHQLPAWRSLAQNTLQAGYQGFHQVQQQQQ